MAKYEWHEECDGPICQRCDNCMCEGGCVCAEGWDFGPEATVALGRVGDGNGKAH
jgi:hypothetical protein